METIRKKVEFLNAAGEKLAALLASPPRPLAYALFAHCFTCSKDIAAATRISRALAGKGIAVLRFDFTGLGNSDGDFANTNFSSNIEDLVRAADYLREHHRAPDLLIGHSLGGAAVLAAAHQVPEAAAVITIGAPANPTHVRRLFAAHEREILDKGKAEVRLAGRPFTITRQFLEDIDGHNLDRRIAGLRKALLVFHAPLDDTVPIAEASHIFTMAKHPKSFISLDSADHLLTRKQDSTYVGETIAAWASRYLPAAQDEAADLPAPRPAQGTVRVTQAQPSGFTQAIASHHHDWTADEPVESGGTDLGPNPYELLLSALGACTSMTLRMYADRKQMPLAGVSVTLTHDRIHASDCQNCETEEGLVDRIRREIALAGDLDEAQRERLLSIADRCPVHRTLTNEILIESRLV